MKGFYVESAKFEEGVGFPKGIENTYVIGTDEQTIESAICRKHDIPKCYNVEGHQVFVNTIPIEHLTVGELVMILKTV